MATFRPKSNTCELDFDGKYKYYLPLHEDTADKIDKAFQRLKTLAPKDRQGIDEAYDATLDIIDDILGGGEAEKVMSIYEHPGTLEVWEVIAYIMREWQEAYIAALDELKKTMPEPDENRATRRGRRA
nr:MAG TPA: hypothetical protein [Caudoviricetes sp.]